MRCCSLCAAVSLLVVGVLSSSASEETCVDKVSLQTQPASNLLQAHRTSQPASSALVSERAGYAITQNLQLEANPSGAGAPLNETGYVAVADRCCQSEMKVFIERQITELGLDVCTPDGLVGLVPFHSCEKGPQTFAALTADLLQDSNGTCAWLAPTGQCRPLNAGCPSFPGERPASDCGCSKVKAVPLNFGASKLLHSNLGGKGPDASKPEEIRYGAIGEYPPGQPFDLVVAAKDVYKGNSSVNGLRGAFGQISVNAAGNPASYNGTVNLQFKFFRPNGDTPVVLPEFFFTFVDIDAKSNFEVKEAISGKGYKGYVTDADTEVVVSRAADGLTKITSTKADVPPILDPMQATPAQRKAMVMYFYANTAEFELTLSAPTDGTPNHSSRWFQFSGESVLVDSCETEAPATTTGAPVTTTK